MSVSAKLRGFIHSLAGYGLLDLTIVSLLIMGATGMLTPILPLYLKSAGTSPEQIGFIYTTFQIALATGEFTWGYLTDRVGMKIPLMIGMAIAGLSVAGFTLTNNIAAFYILNLGRALGTSALFPIGRGHIGATVPSSRRATIMAVYMTLQASGRTLGSLMSGFVGERSLTTAVRLPAFLLLAASITAAFLFKSAVHKREEIPSAVRPATDPKPDVPGRNRVIGLITIGAIVTMFHASISVRTAFLSLHAVEAGKMSVTQVGLLFTTWSLVGLLFTMPLGRLADELKWHNAMTIGLLLSSASMAGFAYANSFFFFIIASIFNGLSTCIFRPAANARFSETMPRRRQATAMGILGAFEDGGNMVGPAMGGILWEGWGGPRATFLLGTVCGISGVLLNLASMRKKKA